MMLTWGKNEYRVELGSLNIDYSSNKESRHIPYTKINYQVDRGNEATTITCTLLAKSEAEYEELLILPFKTDTANLELKNYYFKSVKTGESNSFKPIGFVDKYWRVTAEFIALDPAAYDIDTGEPVGDL